VSLPIWVIPIRDIFFSFVPDEEIGGVDGMNILIQSDWFSNLSVALAMDEGLASEDDKYCIFYGERLPWFVRVTATGNTGHGSRFVDGTAMEQIIGISSKALNFRQQQKLKLHEGMDAGCSHGVALKRKSTLGDVTSLNITALKAGTFVGGKDVMNVVPSSAEAVFDIRITPNQNPEDIASMLDLWCEECKSSCNNLPTGGGISWELDTNKLREHHTTSTDPDANPWWKIFTDSLSSQGMEVEPQIFPAATDSRFIRAMGLRAFGFSPIRRSPILLHEHDEYIGEDVFIEGCNVYTNVLHTLCMQARFQGDN